MGLKRASGAGRDYCVLPRYQPAAAGSAELASLVRTISRIALPGELKLNFVQTPAGS